MRIGWVLVLASCGRLGFEAVDGDAGAVDTGGDAEEAIEPSNLVPGWSAQLAGSGGSGAIHVHDLVVAASGRISVGLHFEQSIDLGAGPRSVTSGMDLLVATYDGAGTFQSVYAPASTDDDESLGLATDADGNLYVTGRFRGTLTPTPGTTLVSANSWDGFVTALWADGGHRWSLRFGGTGEDFAQSVSVAGALVCVAGHFNAQADLGSKTLTASGPDVFVAAFTTSGTPLWAHAAGGAGAQARVSVAALADGCLVSATTTGAIDFGTGSLGVPADDDVFAAKFDASGSPVWARRYAAPGVQHATGLAVDRLGRPFIVVLGEGGLDYGVPGAAAGAGGLDVYVLALDVDGAPRWLSQVAAGTGDEHGGAIAVLADRTVLVAGDIRGSGRVGSQTHETSGLNDVFAVQLMPDTGSSRWAHTSTNPGEDSVFALGADPAGGAVIGGHFSSTAQVGDEMFSAGGYADGFLLRLDAQ